jgi:hypothetical protein
MKAGELKIHIRNEVETYVLAVAWSRFRQ